MGVDPRWYESFFESDEWLLLARNRDAERTKEEVEFVASQLPEGSRVLDVPCGTGRIAVPLAERGYDVAGLDISNKVLEVARAAGPALDLRQGDMRKLPWPDESFDAVLNLWTAFGYFETRADDERVLDEFARVLRPGGRLVLDTVNQTALVSGFQERSWSDVEDALLLERREYDVLTGRVQAYWTLVRDGERHELAFDHRLYSAPEYADLLRQARFEPIRFCGGFDGSELARDSWHLIVIAERR